MKIAMRQLKAGLVRYIALARAGEVIEVSLRGKPSHEPPVRLAPGKSLSEMVLEDRG